MANSMGKTDNMGKIINFFLGGAMLIVGTPAILKLMTTDINGSGVYIGGLDTISLLIVGTLFPLVFAFGGIFLMWNALPKQNK